MMLISEKTPVAIAEKSKRKRTERNSRTCQYYNI